MFFVCYQGMKVLFAGNENLTIPVAEKLKTVDADNLSIKTSPADPLAILSDVLHMKPRLLVLDDYNLQDQATKLLRKIREVHPNIKIIFLTDNPDMQYGKSVASIGVDYYAIKPISDENIFKAICSIARITH